MSLNNKAITGTIVKLEPVSGRLLHLQTKEVKTDADGWYEFSGLNEGSYTVTALVQGRQADVTAHTIEVPRDGCAQVDVRVHGNND